MSNRYGSFHETHGQSLKRDQDGFIDYQYYLASGRRERAVAFRHLFTLGIQAVRNRLHMTADAGTPALNN